MFARSTSSPAGRILCAVLAADLEPLHRYTSDQYHRIIEAGGFGEGIRVELIDGLLVKMSPKSREHERAVERLTTWLAVDRSRHRLRVAAPLSLADGSEPEPDVAVVATGVADPYHPASAELVIEVAASSQRRDLMVKAPMYAAAGVPVYLVVDLDGRRVIEHTDPRDGVYRSVGDVEQLDSRLPGVPPLAAADVFTAAFS
jgi:Uma2 family endonuclease